METPRQTACWYTIDFVTNSLTRYFHKKGFRILSNEETKFSENSCIVFGKLLSKERVEIKGMPFQVGVSEMQPLQEETNVLTEIMHSVDVILSPISFFRSKEKRSICLPRTPQHIEVLEKLHSYFVSNHLRLKVYLVNEDGSVESMHLKREKNRPAQLAST